MDSIILELQKEAYDAGSSVSDLLRKAYVVARKLKVKDFEDWINKESKGYGDFGDVPAYRSVSGEVKAWNPYVGWIPVIIQDASIMEMISNSKVSQSIPELEALTNTEGENLVITFPHSIQRSLSEMMEFDTKYRLFFGKSQAKQIINFARNVVLEWSLKLEEDGILGEGMSFTKEEKQTAMKQNYNTYNYNGNITNSQIQQNTLNSSQTMKIEQFDLETISKFIITLKDKLVDLNLDPEPLSIVESDINTIISQINSPKPKVNILNESLTSIRSVLEQMTGNLLASGLLYELAKLFVGS